MSSRGKTKKELIASLPQHCFWVYNGPILSDLKELHEAIQHEITPEQYDHHVTKDRNDFADWIEHTLHDSACAKQLRKVKRQQTAADKIKTCLKHYNA